MYVYSQLTVRMRQTTVRMRQITVRRRQDTVRMRQGTVRMRQIIVRKRHFTFHGGYVAGPGANEPDHGPQAPVTVYMC